MPTRSTETLHRYHARNAAAVAAAMRQMRRLANAAIKEGSDSVVEILTRQYALLLAAQIECRLKQLIHEPPVSSTDREQITQAGSQTRRWRAAIDLGFVRAFQPARKDVARLGFTPRGKRDALVRLVDEELAPVTELRNALTHGQWRYVLNADETDTNQQLMDQLARENMFSLTQKETLLKRLYLAVNDLLVSAPTFKRDFDKHFSEVEAATQRLNNFSWEAHVRELREREERGRQRRATQTVGARVDSAIDQILGIVRRRM